VPLKLQIHQLLENNRKWAESCRCTNPTYFTDLDKGQDPDYFWIGCCDSRVPANVVVGLDAGEVFVHRNIGNLVQNTDMNCLAALTYAVSVLKVKHVIVCGHLRCGAVEAAVSGKAGSIIDYWIWTIKQVLHKHEAWLCNVPEDRFLDCICELNTAEQVKVLLQTKAVQEAWEQGQPLHVHGWVFGMADGNIEPLLRGENEQDLNEAYVSALDNLRTRYTA